jgi:hypothetical protein
VNDKLEKFRRNGRGLILGHYPGIRLEELRKTTKNLSHDSRSQRRDVNPGSPEYEAGELRYLYYHVVKVLGFGASGRSCRRFGETVSIFRV